MPWAPIIIALLQWLGPKILERVLEWLERRLKLATDQLPPPSSYASPSDAVGALFDKLIDDLPPWAGRRKKYLLRLKGKALHAGVGSQAVPNPLSETEAAEMATLSEELVLGW